MNQLFVALGLAGIFLGWNAPNHYPPWPAFHLEWLAAVGTALLGAAVFAVRGKRAGTQDVLRTPMPAASIAWTLTGLLPVVQYALGGLDFRGDAALGFLYGAGAGLAVYVGLLWATQQGPDSVLRTLWLTIAAGALAANGLALVQWLRLGPPGWWAMELIDDRTYANFAQPNHFGLLMVWAVVAVTALYETRAIAGRGAYALASSFFGWGVLMSGSRAAMLALAVLALCWLLTRSRVATRLRRSDLALALVIAIALLTSAAPLQELLLLKASEMRPATDVGPRQAIWLHFWAAILERPWMGYGFNQAVAALAQVAEVVQPSRNVLYAHNVVLDLMTWVGVPMALVLTAALLRWMLGWLRDQREAGLAAQRHLVFAVWLALLVQSLLEYPYAHSYFLLPAALLAGAAGAGDGTTPARLPAGGTAVPTRPALALAAVTVALLGLMSWDYWRLEDDFRFNRFARASFSTLSNHQTLDEPWVLDQLGALNQSVDVQARPGMSAAELESMHRLARRFHMVWVRLEYAKALALNGRLGEAEHELRVIRSISRPAAYEPLASHWKAWLAAQQAAGRA